MKHSVKIKLIINCLWIHLGTRHPIRMNKCSLLFCINDSFNSIFYFLLYDTYYSKSLTSIVSIVKLCFSCLKFKFSLYYILHKRTFTLCSWAEYQRESKVIKYFDNVKDNSAAPDVFTKVVKVTNHTRL